MDDIATVFRVKDGKLGQWVDWCLQLRQERRDEALLTLEEEETTDELCAVAWIEGKAYVFGFACGRLLPANMSRAINREHQRNKQECLELVGNADVLYHLCTPCARESDCPRMS